MNDESRDTRFLVIGVPGRNGVLFILKLDAMTYKCEISERRWQFTEKSLRSKRSQV